MTIVEAANILLEYFGKKDSFSMEDNYAEVMRISETPSEDKMAFVLALQDLEKADIVKSDSKNKIYILKKPLNSFDQNIQLGGMTANLVAKIINDFCDKIKDKRDYCDAKNLTEKDLRNLVFLASLASPKEEENVD